MQVIEGIRALTMNQVSTDGEASPSFLAAYKRTIFDFIHFYETGLDPDSALLRPWGNNVRRAIFQSLDELVRNAPSPTYDRHPFDRISPNSKAAVESLTHALSVLQTIAATIEDRDSPALGCDTATAIENAIAAIASIFVEVEFRTAGKEHIVTSATRPAPGP